MIIIGEKLNGSIPSCGKAIAARDEAYIRETAIKQAEAGADYLDVCASVNENEAETLKWMIDIVQDAVDVPISVDSPSAKVCVEAMKFCKKPGIINSVSGEGDKIDTVFPVIADTEWEVMALLCDDNGIPHTADERIAVLERIMAKAEEFGIAQSRIHVDPMIEMLCASEDGANVFFEVIRRVRARWPEVHISGGVSNISFNLPVRRLVNQTFTALAVAAGMDSAVIDPTNRDMVGTIFAAEALLGRDFYCMEYIGAYRENRFGPLKEN